MVNPKPRDDAFCLALNSDISKVGYYRETASILTTTITVLSISASVIKESVFNFLFEILLSRMDIQPFSNTSYRHTNTKIETKTRQNL